MIDRDYLVPGAMFRAPRNPWTITPIMADVTVVWVDELDVHYRIATAMFVKSTPIERFLEIINGTSKATFQR